jgi:hypothetical protein
LVVALIALALAVTLLVVISVIHASPLIATAEIALAGGSLVAALGLALTKIAAANEVVGAAGASTAYSAGSIIGVLAAVLLVVATIVSREWAKLDRSHTTRSSSNAST